MAIFQTYTVRRGDTLDGIAKAFGLTRQALMTLNGIANANRIRIGQVLRVRQVSESFKVAPAGSTVQDLAVRTGVPADQIAKANGVSTTTDVGGKGVVIPSTSPAAGPVPPPDHMLGSLSAKYESGNRGPGTVSGGQGDRGGVSYGQYQLASKLGRPAEFLAREGQPWAQRFAGLQQGTPAFTAVWKQIAAEDGARFGTAQHEYIRRTHYDVQANLIREATGVDVAQRSAALRDVVWSTAVQHGGNSSIITGAIQALGIGADSPDFDSRLIDAVYLERGRRDENGVLVHFSRNSAQVQDGVAARFRAERIDAQAMLKAEVAGRQIVEAAKSVPQAGEDDLLERAASRLSDADVGELLERYGDDEARADFASGQKVLIALRNPTNWKRAELGAYDDPMILIWKEGTSIRVQRLKGNTEPAGAYAAGHERANRGSDVDFDGDGRKDLGRLRPGVYHYRPEQHPHLGSIWRARDIQIVDRDCNHDGQFTADEQGDPSRPSNAGTTMYIHKGGTTFTGSAGCQTLPPDDFAKLLALAGRQRSLSYILINAG